MVDLQQLLTPAPPTYPELWDHVVDNILMLDDEEVKYLQKFGLSSMSNIFMYMTNLDRFNTRFKDERPMIMILRCFIMHCYINDYDVDPAPLMKQTEESFNKISTMELEMDYEIKLAEAVQQVHTPTTDQFASVLQTYHPTSAGNSIHQTTTSPEQYNPSSSTKSTTTSFSPTPLAPSCHFTPTIKSANASTHASFHLPHNLSTRMASINIKFEHEHQPLNDTYTTEDTSSTNTDNTSNNTIGSHESDTSAHQHYNSANRSDNDQSSTHSSHDDSYNHTSPRSISSNSTSSTSNTHDKLDDMNPNPSPKHTFFNTDVYDRCGLSQQEYDAQSHISAEPSSHDNDSKNGSYHDSNQEYDDNMSYYSE